ncbi:MAG: PD-(D/E)XK nuclease family protein [Candidatus Magnetominusculus sp. LBB02]|nr:PD-(D/E)XK nuclease family protein [Candidatus Magnetominusculus sp. LBB02]
MLSVKYASKLVKIRNGALKQQADSLLSFVQNVKPAIQECQISQVKDISKFVNIMDAPLKHRIEVLLKAAKEVKPKIQEYQDWQVRHSVENAPEWNIFKVLGIESKEVDLHTPFLHGLLDPNGTHGQGRLFLDSFMGSVVGYSAGLSFSDRSNPSWYVEREKERIDLRICNDWLKKGIYIENKVYTATSSGQLSRYMKLWHERYERIGADGAIYFLTIDGEEPPDEAFDSYGRFTRWEIEQEIGKIRLLSYKRDIKGWLEGLMGGIKPQKLKQSIIQYIEIIDNL